MTKKYQITTTANLLLDMDYSLDDHTLAALDFKKGIQTMIDESQHETLLQQLALYQPQTAAGGACTNSIFAAACLGANTFVNGRIGKDIEGDILLTSLQSANISHNSIANLRTEGNTGKCVVLVTPDAERTMITYLGISSEIPFNCIEPDSLANCEYCLVEGFQCIPQISRETNLKAIQIAHANNAKIAVSLCDEAIVEYFHAEISQFLSIAPINILFCNQHEAIGLTRTTSVNEAMAALQKMAQTVVITLGPKGAMIWDGHKIITISGIKTQAIDTTGAGDIFVGVFLWALTKNLTFQQAGVLSNQAAAYLVTKAGPRLSPAELKRVFMLFKQKNQPHVVG